MQQTFTRSLICILALESSKSFPQVDLKPVSVLWSLATTPSHSYPFSELPST